MRVLFIGGTGIISTSASQAAVNSGIELYVLNRGPKSSNIPDAQHIQADITDIDSVTKALGNLEFDAVVDWISFTTNDLTPKIELFRGRTAQYIFISSASCYQKPVNNYLITESTPLANPYWDYSQHKIACEEQLIAEYRTTGFPITIVRPSLTYSRNLPIAIGGWGCYTLIDRILKDQPIIVHGDGSALWVVTHADDFAKGFVPLIGHPNSIGDSFHITSDEVLSWNQIYSTIARAVGKEANIIHIPTDFIIKQQPDYTGTLLGDKAWSCVFDNSKIKRINPSFNSTIPFHIGVKKTLAWFEQEPLRKTVNRSVNNSMNQIISAYCKQ